LSSKSLLTNNAGKKQFYIASIDSALARAEHENRHDRAKMINISRFISHFHRAAATGTQGPFSNNKHLQSVRVRCRQASKLYIVTGILSASFVPSTEELLAMRYCAPHGELDAIVGGLLAEMGMLHLAQARQNSLPRQEPTAGNAANQAVDAKKGSEKGNEKEVTVNETDDLTALKAQVLALDAQVKALAGQNFVTPNDVGKLAESFKKTIGDLSDKAGSGAEKHDQLVQSVKTTIAEQHQQVDWLAESVKRVADNYSRLEGLVESIETLDAKHAAQQKQIGELAKTVEKEGVKHGQLDKEINLAKDRIAALEDEQLAQRSKPMDGNPAKKAEERVIQSTPAGPSLGPQREQSLILSWSPSGVPTPSNSAATSEKKRKRGIAKAEKSLSPKRSATASRPVDSRVPPCRRALGELRKVGTTKDKTVQDKLPPANFNFDNFSFDK
jgi:hypothetical protein